MYRFVAFIWNFEGGPPPALKDISIRFSRRHSNWNRLDWERGALIFHSPPPGRAMSAIPLPHNVGMILGTLFSSDLNSSPHDISPTVSDAEADDLVKTRGRSFTTRFWGSYIAIFNSRDGTEHYVLRDCSGKIPCYWMQCDGMTVITSNIEDLADLSLRSFSINTKYLVGYINEPELAHRECALSGVTELLAGECLELRSHSAEQFPVWDPRVISREPAMEDFAEASTLVHVVTQACVNCWASKYDHIVHRLSGGLDSSVVLGCLSRSAHRPRLTCLHIKTDQVHEDESEFARLAADAAGAELVFQPGYPQLSKYDWRVLDLPRAVNPSVANLGLAIEPELRNLIPTQRMADVVWDGQGGDHLFFESRSPFSAVDFAFAHGIKPGFRSAVHDAVRISRMSYWGVLGRSLRQGVFAMPWQPENEYTRKPIFLHSDVASSVTIGDFVWQPWLADAADIAPGKRLQICLLSRLLHRHRAVPELQYVSEHHPLFSQPLMELCLRIPTYVLLRGGINRALERSAFRNCVPARIIRRENKGSTSSSLMSTIGECTPFLRELLLDGVLVHERILDREALELHLSGNRPVTGQTLWPFLACIAAEAWARKWAAADWRT